MTIDVSIHVTPRRGADLSSELVRPMTNLLAAMKRRAQRTVPKRSWDLHNSLATRVEREGGAVVGYLSAGNLKVRYARYVEYGTSRMRAQPYLRPALLQSTAADLGGR